ncbi:MAG: hypothetical protein RJA99_1473 [Pseudomonadota bacterium]|jgi:hypothetical protein
MVPSCIDDRTEASITVPEHIGARVPEPGIASDRDDGRIRSQALGDAKRRDDIGSRRTAVISMVGLFAGVPA